MVRICPRCGKPLFGNLFFTFISASFRSARSIQCVSSENIFKCRNCGYRWQPYDEVNALVTSLLEMNGQAKDNSFCIDNFAEVIKVLDGYREEKHQKIIQLINNYKVAMRDLWMPDKDGTSKFKFTKDKDVESRKVIFIAKSIQDVAGYWDNTHSIDYIFTYDCYPPDIKFPLGRPQANTLYVAHPVKTDLYIPYDDRDEYLFLDKVRELKRILLSLGATEITFTSIKGKSTEEFRRESQSASVKGSILGHKGSARMSSEVQQERFNSKGLKVDFIVRNDPNHFPSLPDNLYWYDTEDAWKAIVEDRLKFNQKYFELSISTKQVSAVSELSHQQINAAYKNLVCKIKANHNSGEELHDKTVEETMWRITAEFKPLSEYHNSQNAETGKATITGSSAEQEYLEAVKQLVEDGEISEPERHYLEAKRNKLDISEQRASELEASFTTQLIENEQNYLKMYRKYAGEGEITEKQRSILKDIAETYGLSEERVKQLEAKQ